jgi:hypothetical protein
MDKHPIVFMLLVLTFPVWPVLWFPLFVVMLRRRAVACSLLAALLCAALAVASFVAFSRWLEEPLYARIAAVSFGSPAFFFTLLAAANWFFRLFRGRSGQQAPGDGPAAGTDARRGTTS